MFVESLFVWLRVMRVDQVLAHGMGSTRITRKITVPHKVNTRS